MVVKHHFNEKNLDKIFSQVQSNQQVIRLITKPAEKKPWYFYRQLFISNKRVAEGMRFWREHARVLQEAERPLRACVPAREVRRVRDAREPAQPGTGVPRRGRHELPDVDLRRWISNDRRAGTLRTR